jgi:ABC-2 type transport system ATP-binding protein
LPESAIATYGLTKFYGRVRAVHDLNLQVEVGEIFGFLGPNGAGKSTTIRLLLDLIHPTAGRAEILGLDTQLEARSVHARVGYLPGDLSLYPNLSGQQFLAFIDGLRGGRHRARYHTLAERLSLDLAKPIRSYSRGMAQKLGLIQALMAEPPLLILDEPTSGLDPLVQVEVYGLLREEQARGTTVFFSSHNLPEVERVCDRVGIIREGELVAVEHVQALRARRGHRVELALTRPVAAEDLDLPGVSLQQISDSRAVFGYQGPISVLLNRLAALPLQDVAISEPPLEEVFLRFYEPGLPDTEERP